MHGFKIRKGATRNELVTDEGTVFDLSDKKKIHLITALVIKYLENKGMFKKEQAA